MTQKHNLFIRENALVALFIVIPMGARYNLEVIVKKEGLRWQLQLSFASLFSRAQFVTYKLLIATVYITNLPKLQIFFCQF
jgi:hypothetical protein